MKKGFWIIVLLLTACSATQVSPTPTLLPQSIFVPLPAGMITSTAVPTPTTKPTSTPTPNPATPTPSFYPYEQYSIEHLQARSYGGGTLDRVETLEAHDNFTTYSVRYLSDGLYIYAIMNVPKAEGLHPVVIWVHGFYEQSNYDVLKMDHAQDNVLAAAGFITIEPTLRNYPPSQNGDNHFRVGDAIDILNLIAILKVQARQPGPLLNADANFIGIGGHSMGGGVVLRVVTVSHALKAAFLYSPISGDESLNVGFFHNFTHDPQFNGDAQTPKDALAKISPANYYQDITAPIFIAHGSNDRIISEAWTIQTCDSLQALQVDLKCSYYKGEGHDFSPSALEDMYPKMVAFFQKYLEP